MLAMMECVGLSIGEVYSIAHIHTLYKPLGVLFVLPCVTQFLAQTPVSYVYSQFSKHEISRSRLLIKIVLPLEQCHMLHLGKPNYDSKYSNSVVIQRILICLNFYCYCNYR